MSILKTQKREEYRRILKNEFNTIADEILDEIIEYLFRMANIEVSILEQFENEKKDCNIDGESIE